MIEAGAPSMGTSTRNRTSMCPPTGGSHDRTTEAFTLLISIGIPLENTKHRDSSRRTTEMSCTLGALRNYLCNEIVARATIVDAHIDNAEGAQREGRVVGGWGKVQRGQQRWPL